MASKENTIYQCVLVCDSFHNYFGPIGEHYPSCLAPLVNRPILDYTLDSIRTSGIQEVYVFASAHSDLIRSHIAIHWMPKCDKDFNIFVHSSDQYFSLGEVLRDLFAKALIRSDFVLVYGDTVCNLPFKQYLDEFKVLRTKDKSCVMAHLFRQSSPNHRSKSRHDEALVVLSQEKRILFYEKFNGQEKITVKKTSIFQTNKDPEVRFDLSDTHISICSLLVLSLFADNFDYQTRDDFFKGIMDQEEILGNTLHAKILTGSHYAARAFSPKSYDSVSRDILQRWTYPYVPDLMMNYAYQRNHIYKQGISNITTGSILTRNIAIGDGTTIGANVEINCSVFGSNVKIGDNVKIDGSYIWDNAVIEDNCTIKTSMIGRNVHIKTATHISSGCLIADDVVVGPKVTLKEATYVDSRPCDEANPAVKMTNLGIDAKGFLWTEDMDEDDSREPEIWGVSREEESDPEISSSEEEDSDDELEHGDDDNESKKFYTEVLESLERGIRDKIRCENLIVEINGSKHAYNIHYDDVSSLVSRAIIKVVSKIISQETGDLKSSAERIKSIIEQLLPVISNYVKDPKSEMNCLMSMEEFTLANIQSTNAVWILVKMMFYLFEEEVIDESSILNWFNSMEQVYSAITDVDYESKEQRNLRSHAYMMGFINWLKTAEEESD